MVNRAPVYCDIVTRIQVALNVAIPASSLCISRRLYKITTIQAVTVTHTEKRRRVIADVLICVGIPILQMAIQYVVEGRRYDMFEDFGPFYHIVLRPPSIPLFYAWPIVIGCVSLFYSAMTIYQFYKRERQFNEIMSCYRGLNRNRYIRLVVLCSCEMLGTVPLSTLVLVRNLKYGFQPWVSWTDVHSYYSHIFQYPSIAWKHDPAIVGGLEFFRWSLVLCAFAFFSLFGFADEARQNYRRLYRSLATRVGSSTLSGTFIGSSHATSSLPHLKSEARGVMVSVAKSRIRRDSIVSFSDQLSIPSISIADDLKHDFTTEQISPLESMASSSVSSFADGLQAQLPQLPETALAFVPASIPPQLPDTANSTIPSTLAHSPDAADIV